MTPPPQGSISRLNYRRAQVFSTKDSSFLGIKKKGVFIQQQQQKKHLRYFHQKWFVAVLFLFSGSIISLHRFFTLPVKNLPYLAHLSFSDMLQKSYDRVWQPNCMLHLSTEPFHFFTRRHLSRTTKHTPA